MDVLTPEQRKRCMSRIRSKDTRPEVAVRRLVHGLGYRFRLHRADLPGKPDLVFPSRRKVIFVHGCFWHRHQECKLASQPKSRYEYWQSKFERTIERDQSNQERLQEKGWDYLIIWECQSKKLTEITDIIEEFLDS
jgi:DNA mismatch endonuclease (patch repair protein)